MPNGFPHFQIDEEEGRFFWRLFGDVGKLMTRCPEAGLESREACEEAIRWSVTTPGKPWNRGPWTGLSRTMTDLTPRVARLITRNPFLTAHQTEALRRPKD